MTHTDRLIGGRDGRVRIVRVENEDKQAIQLEGFRRRHKVGTVLFTDYGSSASVSWVSIEEQFRSRGLCVPLFQAALSHLPRRITSVKLGIAFGEDVLAAFYCYVRGGEQAGFEVYGFGPYLVRATRAEYDEYESWLARNENDDLTPPMPRVVTYYGKYIRWSDDEVEEDEAKLVRPRAVSRSKMRIYQFLLLHRRRRPRRSIRSV